MRMDSTSSTSSSPSAYEHAIPVYNLVPQKTFQRDALRHRKGSYSSSNTSYSGPSFRGRLNLNLSLPGPTSTCAAVEADVHPAGCFTPTSPVYDSLRSISKSDKTARRLLRFPIPRFLLEDYSRDNSPVRSAANSMSISGSPTSAFSSIPSISRTVSFDEPEAKHPVPTRRLSGHARCVSLSQVDPRPTFTRKPTRPATTPSSPRPGSGPAHGLDSGMSPILAAAEDASRLRTDCVCSMCGRVGANFPRSARTGEVWCSRECRIDARERQRHQPTLSVAQPITV